MKNVERNIRTFEKQAARYDQKREKFELDGFRRSLLSSASGAVLELGVGAGTNLPYYRSDVVLTAVDFSPAMLEKAEAANHKRYHLQAEFIQGDVDSLTLHEQYDTVVSTLSLCAYRNPQKVLRSMSKWCKPGGRLLLMEHGISSNRVFAAAQKLLDPVAYRFIGCHHNRDIMGLVEASPLQVERVEHYMAGILHLIWCRPGD